MPAANQINGPYCDPTVNTCPGQASSPSGDGFTGPSTDNSGNTTGQHNSGGDTTDNSGGGDTTDNSGGGDTTDNSGGDTTDNSGGNGSDGGSSTDTVSSTSDTAPATGGQGSSGNNGGGSQNNSNSLFGNTPLPAADAPPTPATETSLNIWAVAGAALIVLAVIGSHLVATVRQRRRKGAAPAA